MFDDYSFIDCELDGNDDYFATIMNDIHGGHFHAYLSEQERKIYESLYGSTQEDYVIKVVKSANRLE